MTGVNMIKVYPEADQIRIKMDTGIKTLKKLFEELVPSNTQEDIHSKKRFFGCLG